MGIKQQASPVSMADIARHVNVSKATVSYVLNKRESQLISAATREKVLAAARELGYQTNRAAQALAGRPSYLIELCVHGFYPAFYAFALDAFDQQIAATPYQLHIVKPSRWNAKDWDSTDGSWPVDGLMALDAFIPPKVLATLKQRGTPVVKAGIYSNPQVDNVTVNLTPALEDAMRHLAKCGRRIACLSPWDVKQAAASPDPRFLAYRRVMQEQGLPEEVIVTPERGGAATRLSTRDIVRDYIVQNGCPNGIFCFNDERAVATLSALRSLNLRVPEDVSLIGCDGIEETLFHTPTLSTIAYPLQETARLAWQFLQQRIAEPDVPRQSVTLTAQLVLRESSAR